MSSFSERLKKITEAAKRKLSDQDQSVCEHRHKKKKQLEPVAVAGELCEDHVLKAISGLLEWKLYSKCVEKLLKRGLLYDNWLIFVQSKGNFICRKSCFGADLVRSSIRSSIIREFTIAGVTGRNNLSPPCLHFLADSNTLILNYMSEYTPWNPEQIRQNYRICIEFIKQLHKVPVNEILACKESGVPFNVFEACEELVQECHKENVILPDNIKDLLSITKKWQEFLSSTATAAAIPDNSLVLCHNDLCGENFLVRHPKNIKENIQLKLVDFEYAAVGDRMFDLANFARLNQFTTEEDVLILKIYFGQFDEKQMLRMQLFKCMGNLHEALRIWTLSPHYKSGILNSERCVDLSTFRYGPKELDKEVPTTSPSEAQEVFPCCSTSDKIRSGNHLGDQKEATAPAAGNEEGEGYGHSYGNKFLPERFQSRALSCFKDFEENALNEEFTEYLSRLTQ